MSTDTLRRWERTGRVRFQRKGNRRMMAAEELTRLLRERQAAGSGATSARNRFTGVVLEVKRDAVMAQVEMVCGEHRIVSLMSREAADELDLRPGMHATAVIKSTSVIVEL
ncbi:MAG: TOBE domain-containing protein [Actinomycetota bacterium]|nr:TOBE domain-containing protein [Actinomycetota bacterium]